MAKPGGRNPGGRVAAKALIGGSKSGGRNNRNFKGGGTTPPGVNMLNPSQSGNPDVVLQRAAAAGQGRAQSKQLKKNKSRGLGPLGKTPKAGKPKGAKNDPNDGGNG